MAGRRLQENYNFCIQGYLQEKGARYYIPYELEHTHGNFVIKNWPYTDIAKPTNRDLVKILNKNELLKVMKYKTLLETVNKSYWYPIMRKIIINTRISQNPDEYMYNILWGPNSRVARDEEGVEEEKEEREKEERETEEREREEREGRVRMEISSLRERLKLLQQEDQSQLTEEENKERMNAVKILSSRLQSSMTELSSISKKEERVEEEREEKEREEREKKEREEREKKEKEEREKKEKEEKEKKEKEEREEREREEKYKNMTISEIRKRLNVLQQINQSQLTEEEIKEMKSLRVILLDRMKTSLTTIIGRRFKRESGEEEEGKDYVIDDVGVIDFS